MDSVNESVIFRRDEISQGIKFKLKGVPVSIDTDINNVLVHFQELLICGVQVSEEVYKIFNASDDWKEETTYLCNKSNDGTWFYYVDTIDEVIDEMARLVIFEATKSAKKETARGKAEELHKIVTLDSFKIAYSKFIIQADENAQTGKGKGSRAPFGFPVGKVYGCNLSQHFGQGAASKTPYINWHVVSIYYLPESGKIVVGIEENRYAHMKEMKPKRYTQLGRKDDRVAVFYETYKDSLDYTDLYNAFMSVCDEVYRLGLEYLK